MAGQGVMEAGVPSGPNVTRRALGGGERNGLIGQQSTCEIEVIVLFVLRVNFPFLFFL